MLYCGASDVKLISPIIPIMTINILFRFQFEIVENAKSAGKQAPKKTIEKVRHSTRRVKVVHNPDVEYDEAVLDALEDDDNDLYVAKKQKRQAPKERISPPAVKKAAKKVAP